VLKATLPCPFSVTAYLLIGAKGNIESKLRSPKKGYDVNASLLGTTNISLFVDLNVLKRSDTPPGLKLTKEQMLVESGTCYVRAVWSMFRFLAVSLARASSNATCNNLNASASKHFFVHHYYHFHVMTSMFVMCSCSRSTQPSHQA
jgi:hypothetical protein